MRYMPKHYMNINVHKGFTCDYMNMCGTADSLMLKKICATQQAV
jgi:hypothetical protein